MLAGQFSDLPGKHSNIPFVHGAILFGCDQVNRAIKMAFCAVGGIDQCGIFQPVQASVP